MKKTDKPKVEKKNLKVKDLPLKSGGSKNIKGGAVGPCDRSKY